MSMVAKTGLLMQKSGQCVHGLFACYLGPVEELDLVAGGHGFAARRRRERMRIMSPSGSPTETTRSRALPFCTTKTWLESVVLSRIRRAAE